MQYFSMIILNHPGRKFIKKNLLFCLFSCFLLIIFVGKAKAFPTGVVIEYYFPDDYYMALYEDQPVSSITVTAPDKSSYTSSSTRIQIGNRPDVGDIYNFDISYSDGSNAVYQYTVDGINDNFAFMTSPGDGEFIDSTTPILQWQQTENIQKYGIIIGGSGGFLWSVQVPGGIGSCVYNFDGNASGVLVPGQTYTVWLHTFDDKGHQATTISTFTIRTPPSSRLYRMEFTYDTSIDNPMKAWLPIPRYWDGNGVKDLEIIDISPSPTDRYSDPNSTGTEIGYWELSGTGNETVRITFDVELSLIEHFIDEEQTWPPYDTSSEIYIKNTASTAWVQANNPDIIAQANSIVGTEENPYKKAKLFHAWVSTEIEGNVGEPPLPDGDALLVFQRGSAGCGGFANLFVAFCRSQGIPARNVASWTPPMDNWATYFGSGSHCYNCMDPGWGTHVWAEFYLPNYGWVQCDPTQTTMFAKIPQERIVISKGNDILFDHDHTCGSDEGWNLIGQEAPWFHLPRVPCQTASGLRLDIEFLGVKTPCQGDVNQDSDVDGGDLAEYIGAPAFIDLDDFAAEYGRNNCL